MLFHITMNMPAKNGAAVHQIIAEHKAETLEAFLKALSSEDFTVVNEFYVVNNGHGRELSPQGQIALNFASIGKVKLFNKDKLRD